MNKQTEISSMLLAVIVTISVFAAMIGIASAQQGPEIQVTDSESEADQPDPAVDSQGNVHIAFTAPPKTTSTSYYQTFGTSPNRYTVIEWDTIHYYDGEPGKFQAILYENGDVDINILDNTGAVGESPIIGVNQGDCSHGVDIGGTPASGSSYRFTWNGVDDYTYRAIAYNWIDASGGNPVGAECNDCSGTVPIGFDFTFYVTSYDTVYVSSNGYMSFTITDPTEYYNPISFPSWDSEAANAIAPLWTDWCPEYYYGGSYEIWYTMLDNNGNTLIDDTLISEDDEYKSKRPAIVVDSEDNVHIVWQDKRTGYSELFYTKLDPSLDDQDGDAADESVITVVDDKQLTDLDEDYAGHPRIDIDANDNIHIVWEIYDIGVYYMQTGKDGNEIVSETLVRFASVWRASPDVAVDSNNNAHITWNDDEDTDEYETYYMMLDGSDGSTMIDATLITPDDDENSKRQSIVVGFDDKVHIIWQDKRGDATEIYYTKLDPSPADGTVSTLIDDTALTPDNDNKSNHPASAIGCGRYIHITWYEEWDTTDYDGDIHYMILDSSDGSTVVPDTTLIAGETATTTTLWTMTYLDVDSNGKAHITWCDDRTGSYEVFYTNYQGPLCPQEEPYVRSSDEVGDEKDTFGLNENIYCYAGNLPKDDTAVNIYVVPNDEWNIGDPIGDDVSGDDVNLVSTDASGNIGIPDPVMIWPSPLEVGQYDIIVDLDQDGILDEGEPVDDITLEEGVEAVPEFSTIAIPVAAILGLLFFFNHRKCKKE